MVYDHLEYFSGVALPFAADVGALAFPLFAYALAGGTCVDTHVKNGEIVVRLLKWGALAQVVLLVIRDPLPLNVMFTLAAGLTFGTVGAHKVTWQTALSLALVAVAGAVAEFSIAGVLFVALVVAAAHGRLPKWAPYPAALLLVPFNEFSLVPLIATPMAAYVLRHGPVIPRIKRAFYPLYVVQWPVLRLLG